MSRGGGGYSHKGTYKLGSSCERICRFTSALASSNHDTLMEQSGTVRASTLDPEARARAQSSCRALKVSAPDLMLPISL